MIQYLIDQKFKQRFENIRLCLLSKLAELSVLYFKKNIFQILLASFEF